jgi:hypothetical protein
MHRFPIALHPIRPKTYGSNDSGQVLALPPNRGASDPAQRFRRGCPFRQALRDFAGTTRRASHGPRSSTKILFENSTSGRSIHTCSPLIHNDDKCPRR